MFFSGSAGRPVLGARGLSGNWAACHDRVSQGLHFRLITRTFFSPRCIGMSWIAKASNEITGEGLTDSASPSIL